MAELEIKLKEEGKISRLTNKTFNFPKEIATGFYSANYFLKSKKIVETHERNQFARKRRLSYLIDRLLTE